MFAKKKQKQVKSDLIPRGIASTVIPDEFIDGNTNPIWDNNHPLLKNSVKSVLIVKKKIV